MALLAAIGIVVGLAIVELQTGGQPRGPQDSAGFPPVGEPRFVDVAADADPAALWGSIDCERESRVRLIASGGDPRPRPDGEPQGNEAFRRLRVLDGDDYSGERCELGRNDHQDSPVALYREGDHLITFVSLRLPSSFPLEGKAHQAVLQMKQSQPSDAGGGPPVLSLRVVDGQWVLRLRGFVDGEKVDVHDIWSAPARTGSWIRFAFDVVYSTDPNRGSVLVLADLNSDGDTLDSDERSLRAELATLKPEIPGDSVDDLTEGAPIPSHLRVGIYHDASYRCPPNRCSIDIDNVGVYAP